MRAFALCSLLTSPISAINLTTRTSPTPPISLTVEYSGRDFASVCIRVKMRDRELSTVLNVDTASCTNILVDGVPDDSVGMPLEANSYTASSLDLLLWYFFSSDQAIYSSVNFSRLIDVIRSKCQNLSTKSLSLSFPFASFQLLNIFLIPGIT